MIGFSAAGDPSDPDGYSGVPAALLEAFGQLGAEVRPLRAELSPGLQRLAANVLAVALTRPSDIPDSGGIVERIRLGVRSTKPRVHARAAMSQLRSLALARQLRSGPRPSVCVQFGSEYRMPRSMPYVTYDDATIVQLHREYAYPWMQEVPARELDEMIDRQRAIFLAAERCCVTNHWTRESAISDYGVAPERIMVTGQGARPLPRVPDHDWSRPRFLFVGKEWERKNGPRVLRAFERVRAVHAGAQLDVVGGHPPISQSGVTAHGLLALGDPAARARLAQMFAQATCLVLPSLLEPSALVFAEAQQAGLPCIGGARGGSATIIGDAGIVVEPEDDDALQQAMLTLCEERALTAYAAAARRRAPLFTWRAVAGRVLRAAAPPGLDVSEFATSL